MNEIEIYLAHALTDAPESFRQRMLILSVSIDALPDIRVLKFNWVPGKGPDRTINTYVHDMDNVHRADLVIAVMDHPSTGLGMEVQERCKLGRSLICFYPKGTSPTQIVPDCIAHFAEKNREGRVLQEPVAYRNDQEIVTYVARWIRAYRQSFQPVGI